MQVSVHEAGMYVVMAKTNAEDQMLYKNVKIDDVVYFDQNNCYEYQSLDSTKEFQLKLTTYSGLVSYTVNF